MKPQLICLFLMLCLSSAYAQTDSIGSVRITKQDLLRKSITQKIVGWTIVGTGMPVAGTTLAFIILFNKRDFDQEIAFAVLAGSALYTFIGTQFIKAGRQNQKQAMSLGFFTTKVDPPVCTNGKSFVQPGLVLRIALHY